LLALFLSIGLQQTAMAQNETTVTGRVLDNEGKGLPNVSVQIKGTHSGAMTDDDGNFMVKLPENHNVLLIQSSGFDPQEIKVTNPGQPLLVKMQSKTLTTINIYGQTIDPRTNTGSVSTVTAKEIEKKPITNIVKALDATAGIQLTSGGGQPGSDPQMLVRGVGSLFANNSPLVVVDGVVYSGSMSSINPSDVATISLLKDATASSLYGARGAGGVVLITTKKGSKSDKPQINIDAQTGFVSNFLPQMDVISDPAEYYKMAFLMVRDWAKKNGYISNANDPLPDNVMSSVYWDQTIGGRGYNNFSLNGKGAIESSYNLINKVTGDINPDAKLMYHEDWLPELQRTGLRQQYNVSTSNGNDKSNYYFSLGYNNDEGIVQYSSFERVTTKLNVDAHITPWLKTGLNMYGVYENTRAFTTQSNAYINPFFTAQVMAPIYPVHLHDTLGNTVYGADGKALYDMGTNMGYSQFRKFGANTNVVAALQADDHTSKNYSFRGISYLEAKFLKDFTARVDYTLEFFNYNNTVYQNMLFGDGEGVAGIINQDAISNTNYTFRQRVVWAPSFGPFASGDHSFALTLDHENNLMTQQNYSLVRSGFTDPVFRQGDAAAVDKGSGSSIDQLAIESYLAYANYDYKKKYFLKASIRRDGTSRFSPSARWGNFWSAGAGWMISEENFMASTRNWLSELKLKASYGIQGKEDLGSSYYAWLPEYYFSPNATTPGYLFNTYGSEDLHWEGSYMFDAGFDFGFLNNRITGSLDYYRKGSYDLLYMKPFAPSTGIGGVLSNIGSMLNSGVELTVNADILRTSDFIWNAEIHLSHNKNQMTKMQGDSLVIYPSGITILKKGLAQGTFFLPKYAGVDPDNGDELWELADGTYTNDYSVASLPENKRIMGTPWPDVEGAFINTLSYKNVSLSIQLNFAIGGKFYDVNYYGLMQPGNAFSGQTWSTDILDSWTPENTDASLPRLGIGEESIGGASDRFLISRTFLKVQNINLSYSLPERWVKDAKFRSASVFLAADNVYLFAARKGVDVETSFFGTNSLSYYPYRTVMFGVKLGL